MMLVRVYAELSKRRKSKKAVSNVIVVIFLIVISVTAILVFWYSVREIIKKSPDTSCIDLISSFSIKKACYLNNEELLVQLNRGFDNSIISKMRFSFTGEESSLFEIIGEKCSDVKTLENYGSYTEVLNPGETRDYVFNISSLDKKIQVRLAVGNNELCSVYEGKIEDRC